MFDLNKSQAWSLFTCLCLSYKINNLVLMLNSGSIWCRSIQYLYLWFYSDQFENYVGSLHNCGQTVVLCFVNIEQLVFAFEHTQWSCFRNLAHFNLTWKAQFKYAENGLYHWPYVDENCQCQIQIRVGVHRSPKKLLKKHDSRFRVTQLNWATLCLVSEIIQVFFKQAN